MKKLYLTFILALTALGVISPAFSQIEFFVEVDPMDGAYTKIQDINELQWIQILPSMTTLNEVKGHYIFQGIDNVDLKRLWSIDVTDGQTIHFPQFPNLSDPLDNVANLLADNKNDKLFAVSWDDSAQEEWFVEIDPQTGTITYISVIPDIQYI